jgi:hypothetical protein
MQNYLSLVNPDNPQTCLMLSDEFEGFHAEQLKLMPAPVSIVYLYETGYGYVYGYVYGDGYGHEYGYGYGDGYGHEDGYGDGLGYANGVGYAKLSISS